MNNKLLKKALISSLFIVSFSLASCGKEPPPPEAERKDVNYTVTFEGLNDQNKSFITLEQTSGTVNSFENEHSFSFNVADGLNIDNLKIKCNNSPVTFKKEAGESYGSKYSSYYVTTNPVTNNGIDDLNYKIDLSECTFNTYDLKVNITHPTSELKLKYYVEYDIKKYNNYEVSYQTLNASDITLTDMPENNIITQPSGTTLFLFIPEEWHTNDINLNFVDEEFVGTTNLNLYDSWNNGKRLLYKEPINNEDGGLIEFTNYEVSAIRRVNESGEIKPVKVDAIVNNQEKIEFEQKDGIFNIATINSDFGSNMHGFNMYISDEDFNVIGNEEGVYDETIDYKVNGTTKTIHRYSYGKSNYTNQLNFITYPMRFNDSRNPTQHLYDAYFVRLLDDACYTEDIIQDLTFELYTDSFEEGPKVVIPHKDIYISEITNGIYKYVIVKVTPEMIQPYVKEMTIEDKNTLETSTITSGRLYLTPKLVNDSKVVKVSWDDAGELYGRTGESNARLPFKIKRFFDKNNPDPVEYQTYNPMLTLDSTGKVVALFDKNIVPNLTMEYEFRGDSVIGTEAFLKPRLRFVRLTFGEGPENYFSAQVNKETNRYESQLELAKYFVNDELHFTSSYEYYTICSYVTIDFSVILDNPNYDFYYSTSYQITEFDRFNKLSADNVENLTKSLIRPRDKMNESFVYFLKPKPGADPDAPCELTFEIEVDGEKLTVFNTAILVDIFSFAIMNGEEYVYYINLIDSPIYVYQDHIVVTPRFK